jgi:hypothetical protein
MLVRPAARSAVPSLDQTPFHLACPSARYPPSRVSHSFIVRIVVTTDVLYAFEIETQQDGQSESGSIRGLRSKLACRQLKYKRKRGRKRPEPEPYSILCSLHFRLACYETLELPHNALILAEIRPVHLCVACSSWLLLMAMRVEGATHVHCPLMLDFVPAPPSTCPPLSSNP